MPALGPKGVAEVSRIRMMGLVKMVTPQLKRLSFCRNAQPLFLYMPSSSREVGTLER